MAGILGYLSVLADDVSSLAGKTMAAATKTMATSLDDVGLLFDDIATYTKLASVKSSGLVVDDLAAIANFTNETTSDILKNELNKAKTVDEFKHNVELLDEKSQKEILNELEKNNDYKFLYLDGNNIDLSDCKYENEIITNLRGIIKKSNLYLENGKMIKIYTNNKNILPKNTEKITIISGHLAIYRGNIQIILYSTSDFKIGF